MQGTASHSTRDPSHYAKTIKMGHGGGSETRGRNIIDAKTNIGISESNPTAASMDVEGGAWALDESLLLAGT